MLKLFMDILGAADEAHAGQAEAPFVVAGLRGFYQLLIA